MNSYDAHFHFYADHKDTEMMMAEQSLKALNISFDDGESGTWPVWPGTFPKFPSGLAATTPSMSI